MRKICNQTLPLDNYIVAIRTGLYRKTTLTDIADDNEASFFKNIHYLVLVLILNDKPVMFRTNGKFKLQCLLTTIIKIIMKHIIPIGLAPEFARSRNSNEFGL